MAQHDFEIDIQASKKQAKKSNQSMIWVLSLYGTAVGAGTLFLPIEAGLHGILPMIIMLILSFPMTYLSHRALCRFVFSGSSKARDITDVVEEYFGRRAGDILTVFYFFSIYPILLMYSVAITNTVQSFIINQLHMQPPPRAVLALILILGLLFIIRFGQSFIIKAMSMLVYPFIVTLLFMSIYLIPHWNTAILQQTHHTQNIWMTLWLLIPIMVFSFNHSPIISSFAIKQRQRFNKDVDQKSSMLLKYSHLMMVFTVMFFVFSCVFSLSPHDLELAKQQNISILSYLANHFHTPLIGIMAPLIAIIAISKSFLGHFLGANEGLIGIFNKVLRHKASVHTNLYILYAVELIIIGTCWLCATLNPNILKMIESLCGPVIAIILYLMPMYAASKVKVLHKYRNKIQDSFVVIIGIVALSGIFYNLLG